MKNSIINSPEWKIFISKRNISCQIEEKLLLYIIFLLKENEKYNLTGITAIDKVISHHLEDSLAIESVSEFNCNSHFADVGSGCGVPGLILAILICTY